MESLGYNELTLEVGRFPHDPIKTCDQEHLVQPTYLSNAWRWYRIIDNDITWMKMYPTFQSALCLLMAWHWHVLGHLHLQAQLMTTFESCLYMSLTPAAKVSKWLNLTTFLGISDGKAHIVHISCVIKAYTTADGSTRHSNALYIEIIIFWIWNITVTAHIPNTEDPRVSIP